MKDQANDKRSPIIAVALLVTAAFLGLFGWLLNGTGTCPDGWWLWHRVSCLEPNALGDTFAGAFAPVAFVWLVAAVLLQRNELAAQRQELREARVVSTQQVEEAKKNVLLIAEQTELLRSDRERVEQREADEDIDEMISILVANLRNNVNRTYITEQLGTEDAFGNENYDSRINVSPSQNDYSELEEYVGEIRDLLIEAGMLSRQGVKFRHSGQYAYSALLPTISQIDHLRQKASPPKRALLNLRGFDGLTRFVPELVNLIKEHGEEEDDIPF